MHLAVPLDIDECKNGEINIVNLFDSKSLSICDQFGGGFDRTNEFWKNLAHATAANELLESVKTIRLEYLWLDDWKPLLQTLQKQVNNIQKLDLDHCHFTNRGARLLGTMLKTTTTSLSDDNHNITNFPVETLWMEQLTGSTEWIHDFYQNKTIRHIYLKKMPILQSAIQFILNSAQLKKAILRNLTCERQERTTRTTTSAIIDDANDDDLNLETLDMSFAGTANNEQEFSLNLCQGIGRILRRANNLKELSLRDIVIQDLVYDFFQDATHCHKLVLYKVDFDPNIVSSLVQQGRIKHLCLYNVKNTENAQRLLQLIDLSRLDFLEVSCPELIRILCHRLLENKKAGAPKELAIHANANFDEFATILRSSLIGNDKIEKLSILSKFDNGLQQQQQQLLVDAMGQMPKLRSWKVRHFGRLDSQDIARWKGWILDQLQSNWTIQEIDPPFKSLGKEIKELLILNKYWRPFFRNHDRLSSGVWAPALSQVKTTSLMFFILGQVPALFQQVANATTTDE